VISLAAQSLQGAPEQCLKRLTVVPLHKAVARRRDSDLPETVARLTCVYE
jgi:hypothetical protein